MMSANDDTVHRGHGRILLGSVEPENWLFCDGRELEMQRFIPLFATIGNQ